MNPTTRTTAFLTLLLAACAGAAGAGTKVFQADHVAPQMKSFDDEAERAMLRDPYEHARLGDMSRASGNLDQARAEDRAAAEGFANFADKFTGSEWRLVFRSIAADRYLRGADWAAAASEAKKLIDDPQSNDTSRAIGARYAAGAWQQVATATRAGRIEPLRELYALQRKGQEPKPRVPPDPWKRFVEYTDLYESLWKLDPQAKPDTAGGAGIDPAGMALFAARVEFAYDNIEDARRRFDAVINAWPSRADILETAVPLYLETFVVLKDDPGFEAAVVRMRALVEVEAGKAAAAAKAPSATPEHLAAMKAAAPDFRLYWDNAYAVHHLTDERVAIANILDLCARYGHRIVHRVRVHVEDHAGRTGWRSSQPRRRTWPGCWRG